MPLVLVVSVVVGVLNALPCGQIWSSAFNGVVSGVSAYQQGATVGASILCGTFSLISTVASIGNLSNAMLDGTLGLGMAVAIDLTFGFGAELSTAGINMAVSKNNQRKSNPQEKLYSTLERNSDK